MYRIAAYFLVLLVSHTAVYGQLKKVEKTNGKSKVVYFLDSNKNKQGVFTFKYFNKLQVSGSYKDNLREGEWIFTPDKKYRTVGYYKNNKKDSIWTTYLNNKLYQTENMRTGSRRLYFPDGEIQVKADSVEGAFHFEDYYKSGSIKEQIISDKLNKTQKVFDEKGQLILHVVFKNDFLYNIIVDKGNKTVNVSFETDIINGTGSIIEKRKSNKTDKFYVYKKYNLVNSKPNGVYEKFNESGHRFERGEYKNGFMVGKWEKSNSKNPNKTKVYNYTLLDSLSYDKKNNIGLTASGLTNNVETMPKFGGKDLAAFRTYVMQSIKYPPYSAKHKIGGRVFVQFAVNSVGQVVDVKVVRGVNKELDKEAKRAIKSSPMWRPGMQKGKAVKVQFTLPVVFNVI